MYYEERRSKEKIAELEVYTDGSLKRVGKTTFGGWAFAVIRDGKEIFSKSANEPNTTNQRMELTAIAEALKNLQTIRTANEKVIIYSDSSYIINCYSQDWYITWQKNGWLNAAKKDVANRDLWEQIIPYFDNFWYYFRKVPAHVGVYWNEYCDKLAQQSADNLKRSFKGNYGQ